MAQVASHLSPQLNLGWPGSLDLGFPVAVVWSC